MEKRKRVLVSLRPEILDIFSKMSEVSGTSLSRCIGDWLESTSEGAQFVSYKMQQVRNSPVLAMREFHEFAKEKEGDLRDLYGDFAQTADAARSPAAPRGRPGGIRASAPSSNTGLKSPLETASKPRHKPV